MQWINKKWFFLLWKNSLFFFIFISFFISSFLFLSFLFLYFYFDDFFLYILFCSTSWYLKVKIKFTANFPQQKEKEIPENSGKFIKDFVVDWKLTSLENEQCKNLMNHFIKIINSSGGKCSSRCSIMNVTFHFLLRIIIKNSF